MIKKLILVAFIASMMSGVSEAQIAIRIGPPPPIVEHYGPPPRPGWVWQGGYHRWDGARYVWTPGHYAAPPRRGARWIPDGYYRRGGRYYYRRGYWR
ncbi:YXWGXW repeat-containing protein [Granulicella sp. dw_53]|uniref:YXWGXW repeat-containing protein n=1 Tax=Granulicella sp. dw_53 TaxID=2719792 RepID=UPI001BD464ED|nr:YXWGXW repeat-containing protein [Granulicella sp. dw_53]